MEACWLRCVWIIARSAGISATVVMGAVNWSDMFSHFQDGCFSCQKSECGFTDSLCDHLTQKWSAAQTRLQSLIGNENRKQSEFRLTVAFPEPSAPPLQTAAAESKPSSWSDFAGSDYVGFLGAGRRLPPRLFEDRRGDRLGALPSATGGASFFPSSSLLVWLPTSFGFSR